MWPQMARRGRLSSIARRRAGLPKLPPPPALSQWSFGGEWRTRTAFSGQGDSIAVAASSSRSKLQSQGVTGIPAPRPKNSAPSIVVPSPCRTVAALQSVAASRSAPADSLLPGTSTVGVSIPDSAPIVSSSPSCIEAKSPAPTTTSASDDIATSFARCWRSGWRSLKARIFIPENLAAGCRNEASEDERAEEVDVARSAIPSRLSVFSPRNASCLLARLRNRRDDLPHRLHLRCPLAHGVPAHRRHDGRLPRDHGGVPAARHRLSHQLTA